MKNLRTSGRTEFLFTMLLFFVFLLCSVFTVLIGSRVYENIRARDNSSFYRGTAMSYVVNKVRQADRTGAVEIREENGVSILVLTSEINGGLYETWIYTLDGSLRELFTPKDSGLTAADGLPVIECPELTFSLEEKNGQNLLTVKQAPSGKRPGQDSAADPPDASGQGGQKLSIVLRSAPGAFFESREQADTALFQPDQTILPGPSHSGAAVPDGSDTARAD